MKTMESRRAASALCTLVRRALLPATLVGAALAATSAQANDKLTLLTSWYAQAEHGGFYQAVAEGIYEKHGLDVTVKMGGPQVNGMQLLLARKADVTVGYDFQVLKSLEQGMPVVAIGACFQGDPQGLLTHGDVRGLDDLEDKTILVATSGQTSWWPWLKTKYGLNDSQTRPYTFNLQPFFADPNVAQQAYASSELFQARQQGVDANFYLFADQGYPPYGSTLVTRRDLIESQPEQLQRFYDATMEGWKSYLANPAPGNALIKQDNPNMTDEQIAWGIERMKEFGLVTGGDSAKGGHRCDDRCALAVHSRLHGRGRPARRSRGLQRGLRPALRKRCTKGAAVTRPLFPSPAPVCRATPDT
jgi:NitT/TauT family transport system substrate-binding protein